MGTARLNIWVRNEECQVIDDRKAHLHIYNCRQEQVFPMTWFEGGHIEVELPPGCYIVTAGVMWGNVYTDKVMVVVGCDQTACVNLVLNRFNEKKAGDRPPAVRLAPIALGCAARILGPLILNAHRANIDPERLRVAAGVILQAAGIDGRQMMEGARREAAFLEENMERFEKEEREEAHAYVKALHGLSELIG
jgi:hypothetical protein